MNTAVQLRSGTGDGPRSEILYGTPHRTVAGQLGPVALFAPGELVAFRIGHCGRTRLFVFRTLAVDDRLAARVPGVHPRVQLLFDVRSMGRARLVRGLFGYLARIERDPAALADDFYVRVGVVLGGRLPPHKILVSLLSPPRRPGQASSSSHPAVAGPVPRCPLARGDVPTGAGSFPRPAPSGPVRGPQ